MKVLVLTGSPHTEGTTALLADEFCLGAGENGHEIIRFDTAQLQIHPCIGCMHCRKNDGTCVFDDDMKMLYPHLLDCDALVLVSPLYYFGLTAQLKTAIDRFFSISETLKKTPKDLYMICAGGNENEWVMDGLKAHIQTLCRFMNWPLNGMLLAIKSPTRAHIENSQYIAAARSLGRGVGTV